MAGNSLLIIRVVKQINDFFALHIGAALYDNGVRSIKFIFWLAEEMLQGFYQRISPKSAAIYIARPLP